MEADVIQEYWVVGGSYRDANFAALKDGTGEVYGPFVSYDEALSSWSARTERSRAEATTRFSVVVTAARR
jgi:hypothetical protein